MKERRTKTKTTRNILIFSKVHNMIYDNIISKGHKSSHKGNVYTAEDTTIISDNNTKSNMITPVL